MPDTCRRLPLVVVLGSAALFAVAGAGCRALRCQQAADDCVAAARQLSLQGLDAEQRGRWEEAEVLFAEAVRQCPRDERARCGYAEALWRRGATADAILHMEEAVRLSGHDPDRLVQLGRMYRGRGDLAAAARQAERAIAAKPQLAAAWALRGEVLQAEGRWDEALAAYHRALAHQPVLPEVQLAIADIYLKQNRPQRSLATLQALAASFPPGQAPPELLFREGIALRALGRHQDAAHKLAEAAPRGRDQADFVALARQPAGPAE